jgi:hypothetical protein
MTGFSRDINVSAPLMLPFQRVAAHFQSLELVLGEHTVHDIEDAAMLTTTDKTTFCLFAFVYLAEGQHIANGILIRC